MKAIKTASIFLFMLTFFSRLALAISSLEVQPPVTLEEKTASSAERQTPGLIKTSNKATPPSQKVENLTNVKASHSNIKPQDFLFPFGLSERAFLGNSRRSNCPRDIKRAVYTYSQGNNVNPYLVLGLIDTESNCNPNAISTAGAKGLMQITHSAEREYHKITGRPIQSNKFNIYYNIDVGTVYFNHLLRFYRNDLHAALVHYNAGGAPYRRALAAGKNTVQSSYSQKVVNRWQLVSF